MSRHVFKLPDLGEGTVSSEIVAWRVRPGDLVQEDQPIVEMSTDKAVVEVPSPVSGRIVSVAGEPGDMIAVGAELVVFETDVALATEKAVTPATPVPASRVATHSEPAERVLASPATRRLAHDRGIDLTTVQGSGEGGRIRREDLDSLGSAPSSARVTDAVEEIKIIGVRRVIAERMSESKRTIPHFTYVEEVDVTELEALRAHLNGTRTARQPSLTYLPFIATALLRALVQFPQCNARYDAERQVIVRHRAVHLGLATQSPDGLKVPVVRQAQAMSFWDLAVELQRVAEGARTNKARREDLTGSTITLTSLGKLGGIVSTPVINSPEVAIVGVNKAVDRPVVHQGAIAVRRIMNLSSSFDHRFVDGFDAAAMIQAVRGYLEHPATLFLPSHIT